jgi:hypothetical protein
MLVLIALPARAKKLGERSYHNLIYSNDVNTGAHFSRGNNLNSSGPKSALRFGPCANWRGGRRQVARTVFPT